jgi:hypothetical protein
MIMRNIVLAAAALAVLGSTPASAKDQAKLQTYPNELNIYREKNYSGDDYLVRRANSEIVLDWNIGSFGVNPGDSWEICAMTHFRNCITISESIPDASTIGINGQIASAHLVKKKDK